MALIHVYNGISEKVTYTFNGKLRDKFTAPSDADAATLEAMAKETEGYLLNPQAEE